MNNSQPGSRLSKSLFLLISILVLVSCQKGRGTIADSRKSSHVQLVKVEYDITAFTGDLEYLNEVFWTYSWYSYYSYLDFAHNCNVYFDRSIGHHEAPGYSSAGFYSVNGKNIVLRQYNSDEGKWYEYSYQLFSLETDNIPYTFNDLAAIGFEPSDLTKKLALISTYYYYVTTEPWEVDTLNTIYSFDGVKFEVLKRPADGVYVGTDVTYQNAVFVKRSSIYEKPIMNDRIYSFKYPDSDKTTDSLFDFSPDEYRLRAFARTVQKFPDRVGTEAYWYLCEISFPGIGNYQNEYFIGGESNKAMEGGSNKEPGSAYGWVYGPDIGLE